MSLNTVLDKLHKLAKTSSTKNKKKLLKDFLQDDLFLKVVKATADQLYHYNINMLPKFENGLGTSIDDIFNQLHVLSKKKGASDADKLKLAQSASIDNETWEVVQIIVKKNLRCGISGKTINSVRPGTVTLVPYCRCSSAKNIHRIKVPAFAQCKADGMFANNVCSPDNETIFLTRNGSIVRQLGKLRSRIKNVLVNYPNGVVPMGELVVVRDGKILDRQTGNGILNQCIQGTALQEDADGVIFRIWDVIGYKEFWAGNDITPYGKRLSLTEEFVKAVDHPSVTVVYTEVINSIEEGREFYNKMRVNGEEGAVLKNKGAIWKFYTSLEQVKMKNEVDIELEIVDWYCGDSGKKYEKCLGGITLRSRCGKLITNVGSGFSDKMRGYFPVDKDYKYATPMCGIVNSDGLGQYIDGNKATHALNVWDNMKGSIVTITCESVIKDKNKGAYSCFLPRFVEIRLERDDADSLKEIITR